MKHWEKTIKDGQLHSTNTVARRKSDGCDVFPGSRNRRQANLLHEAGQLRLGQSSVLPRLCDGNRGMSASASTQQHVPKECHSPWYRDDYQGPF